jgi:hypothetical protein
MIYSVSNIDIIPIVKIVKSTAFIIFRRLKSVKYIFVIDFSIWENKGKLGEENNVHIKQIVLNVKRIWINLGIFE